MSYNAVGSFTILILLPKYLLYLNIKVFSTFQSRRKRPRTPTPGHYLGLKNTRDYGKFEILNNFVCYETGLYGFMMMSWLIFLKFDDVLVLVKRSWRSWQISWWPWWLWISSISKTLTISRSWLLSKILSSWWKSKEGAFLFTLFSWFSVKLFICFGQPQAGWGWRVFDVECWCNSNI